MQVVIEIPEELKQTIDNGFTNQVIINKLWDATKRGIPLDKMRAEIKTKYDSIPWRNNDYDDGWVEALEWVIDDVIDKYKVESEDRE